jgi:hypothetical protein
MNWVETGPDCRKTACERVISGYLTALRRIACLECRSRGHYDGPTVKRSRFANERHHEYATLEHLLLSLIDDQMRRR